MYRRSNLAAHQSAPRAPCLHTTSATSLLPLSEASCRAVLPRCNMTCIHNSLCVLVRVYIIIHTYMYVLYDYIHITYKQLYIYIYGYMRGRSSYICIFITMYLRIYLSIYIDNYSIVYIYNQLKSLSLFVGIGSKVY